MLRPFRAVCLPLVFTFAAAFLLAACDSGVPPDEATLDTATTVEFVSSGAALTEDDGTATVAVRINNPDGQRVTVDVLYGNAGSTTDPQDLGLAPTDAAGLVAGRLAFPADAEDGDTRALTFDVRDEDDTEVRETALFVLQNLTTRGTATLGGNTEFRLEIGFPTLEEIRQELAAGTIGLGDNVTFQAVVQRARGAFTYLSDGTGGFTMRQTGGAFNTSVADGTIAEGTQLQVEGVLSEFAGLLQINNDDLASFTVIAQGQPVPAPVTVTLQDIIDRNEALEGRLVRVENLTIDGGGDATFSAATTYAVTDGSGGGGGTDTNVVTLRLPNASDTAVAGDPIPTGPVTFEGVLGQFNGFSNANPNTGYQLSPVNEGDLIE